MGQTVIVARGALLFGNKADFDDYNDNWRDGIEERDGHESQGRDICQIFRGHGRRPRQATARARGADCRIYMVEVYAILDAKGCVVPCSEQRWRSWYFRRGQKRSLIKRQLLGNYLIETCFYSQVHVLEGEEPNFWRVRLTKPPNPTFGGDSFMAVLSRTIESKISAKAERIDKILRQAGPVEHELSFNTLEDALNHHRQLSTAIRKHERLKSTGPEKAQELLAELGDWCAEKRGRQSELARAIGATPQAVNDWLNGRKSMTGEQALRVKEFVAKTRTSRNRKTGKDR